MQKSYLHQSLYTQFFIKCCIGVFLFLGACQQNQKIPTKLREKQENIAKNRVFGIVRELHSKGISNASVIALAKKFVVKTHTDSIGHFSLELPVEHQEFMLIVLAENYENHTFKIKKQKKISDTELTISLKNLHILYLEGVSSATQR